MCACIWMMNITLSPICVVVLVFQAGHMPPPKSTRACSATWWWQWSWQRWSRLSLLWVRCQLRNWCCFVWWNANHSTSSSPFLSACVSVYVYVCLYAAHPCRRPVDHVSVWVQRHPTHRLLRGFLCNNGMLVDRGLRVCWATQELHHVRCSAGSDTGLIIYKKSYTINSHPCHPHSSSLTELNSLNEQSDVAQHSTAYMT